MITIIIPALNEEEHIASVVQFARSHPEVTEVIVVDDNSSDRTVEKALESGAKVITSGKLGKGTSMKEGVQAASNEFICFLDGDIDPYPSETVSLLTEPILKGNVDFVKSTFDRNAGRVTELVAKPLLSILFPDLAKFTQPLSGMIAGRKSILSKVDMMDDYGVDVGILIDMHLKGITIKEVNIGYLENKSKPWESLGSMSREVAQAIIQKAVQSGKSTYNNHIDGIIASLKHQMETEEAHPRKSRKLILFDMDNTLLAGRFIDFCADAFGFGKELKDLRSFEEDSILLTKQIARLLRGKPIDGLIKVAERIPIVKGAHEIIRELKRRGYLVGIVSDSYDVITNYLKNRLSLDFTLSNELEFSGSICTGEVKIPSFFFKDSYSLCEHTICKTNALLRVLKGLKIKNKNVIAVGDDMNDLCLIKNAGLGVAFNTSEELINQQADHVIREQSFEDLLNLAK
jgi:glucosyl-3-phosphoglycerate synthase